jgi:DNA-directed RNA polymerase specialized sigma24 family protein
MPELTDILHERESRQPGWRSGSGADQHAVNRGVDIVTHLHRVFVIEHRFKIGEGQSADPRPFVNTAARNWAIDAQRKIGREVPLSGISDGQEDAVSSLPDPTVSVEDEALGRVALEESRRELRAWGFLEEEELSLFETLYVEDRPLEETAARLGIPSLPAARKRISRARRKAVLRRDALIGSAFLFMSREWGVSAGGLLSRRGWEERAEQAIDPGTSKSFTGSSTGSRITIRPLTRHLGDSPGHLYLVEIHDPIGAEQVYQQFFMEPFARIPAKAEQERSAWLSIITNRGGIRATGISFLHRRLTGIHALDKTLAEVYQRGDEAWVVTDVDNALAY